MPGGTVFYQTKIKSDFVRHEAAGNDRNPSEMDTVFSWTLGWSFAHTYVHLSK